MITIVEGSACGYPADPDGRTRVRLPARLGRLEPHQLIRTALPVIRRAVTPDAFVALVAPWRAPLRIVFAGLAPVLSEVERQLSRSLTSRLTSHLTHNLPMQELLWRELAGFLLAAHAVTPLELVVEDLRQLDEASFAILCQALRADALDTPTLVIGATADLPELAAIDHRGLVWDIALPHLRQSLAALRRLPHRTVPARPGAACACPVERDPWDHAPDERVAALLRDPEAQTAEARATIAPAIGELFEMFAFDAALRLALDVLDAGVAISVADRATLCGIAALAAHNRQFFSRGNHRIAAFLLDHYRAALHDELDPALRVSLHYRLAVTHARRRGDLAAARAAIAAGLAELADAPLPALERALQEAWLYNIDAMVQVRAGALAAAFARCDQAFAILAGASAPDPVAAAELALSELVLSENALTLAAMTGDEPRRAQWLARSRRGFAHWPSLDVVDALEQLRAAIERLEPARAREAGLVALARAQTKLNPVLEHYILVCLSDLSFRIADYPAAASYGKAARAVAEELGDVNHTQLALELRASEIAEALGQLDAAEHALAGALAGHAGAPGLAVEVQGRLARIAARRGAHAPALARIADAIELASASGELDLLLRASCHAGEVADLLGLADDARTAYAACFELLADASATPARELLRLKAVVGQHRLGATDPAQLAACLATLPRLLARERDAWPLARALVEPPHGLALAPESAAALRVIATAIQRASPVAIGAAPPRSAPWDGHA